MNEKNGYIITADLILNFKRDEFEKHKNEIMFYLKVKKELHKKTKPVLECLKMYNDVVNYLKVKGWMTDEELDRL